VSTRHFKRDGGGLASARRRGNGLKASARASPGEAPTRLEHGEAEFDMNMYGTLCDRLGRLFQRIGLRRVPRAIRRWRVIFTSLSLV
jgi:hypothetical protein